MRSLIVHPSYSPGLLSGNSLGEQSYYFETEILCGRGAPLWASAAGRRKARPLALRKSRGTKSLSFIANLIANLIANQ